MSHIMLLGILLLSPMMLSAQERAAPKAPASINTANTLVEARTKSKAAVRAKKSSVQATEASSATRGPTPPPPVVRPEPKRKSP